jgi:CheY-like chemotaxis protein
MKGQTSEGMAEIDDLDILKGKHLFVIEDNVENRVILRFMLARTGARLNFDIWGRDIVQRVSATLPVHLILLDLMFPGFVSGYTLFEQLRASVKLANVPIVAVSAADAAVAIPKCQKLGFDGFIAKPIDDDVFPAQLVRILNGEKLWIARQ